MQNKFLSIIFPIRKIKKWEANIIENIKIANKNYLNDILQEYIPAHLTYDIFYLNINQIDQFEQTFSKWKSMKNSGRIDQVDSKSLQLIQLLMQYKKDGK